MPKPTASPAADGLMRTALQAAVPLWIAQIRRERWSDTKLTERAQACSAHIAAHGDVLQFGGRKGEAAAAFNRLAEGLACMALVAACGVVFLGDRWEAEIDW